MSKLQIIHFGIIRNQKKVYYNPDLYKKQMLSMEGKEFEEIFAEKLQKPTKGQHGYYRGAIIPTCAITNVFAGWEEEEIDEHFCNLFLKRIVEKELPGEGRKELIRVRSTGDLNKTEMAQFIDKVLDYLAMKHGIEVLPLDNYKLSKYRTL